MKRIHTTGAIVAIYSDSIARELFYLCEVVEATIATEDCYDGYGHTFSKGQEYLKCWYLELKDLMPKKGSYQYMKLKLPVFVKLCQVFCPGVNMQPNFKLPQAEYQFLADTVM